MVYFTSEKVEFEDSMVILHGCSADTRGNGVIVRFLDDLCKFNEICTSDFLCVPCILYALNLMLCSPVCKLMGEGGDKL